MQTKPVTLFFLCLLVSLPSLAFAYAADNHPSTDSLEALLQVTPTEKQAGIWLALGKAQTNRQTGQALRAAREVLNLCRTYPQPLLEIEGLLLLAECQRKLLADYKPALESGHKALLLARQHRSPSLQLKAHIDQAESFRQLGNNYKALEQLSQAETLARSLAQTPPIIEVLNRQGRIYNLLTQHTEALRYHRQALALSQKHKFKREEAASYYWLAETYRQQHAPKTALLHYEKALQLFQPFAETAQPAACLLGLGQVQQLLGEHTVAVQYYKDALEHYRHLQDKQGQANSYNQLSHAFFGTKDYQQAIGYAHTALQLGEQLNDKNLMRASYEALYNSHAALRDFEQALKYKNLYAAISDLIYGEESERHLSEMLTRYEIAKQESQIDGLKKDNQLHQLALEKQSHLRNFLLLGFALLLVIVLLGVFLYRQKRLSNRQLQETNARIHVQNEKLQNLNKTRDKFLGIISHDLKAPLNSLLSFSSLLINHTDALSRQEIKMLAGDLDRSLKNLQCLLDNLLEWTRSQSEGLQVQAEPLALGALLQSNVSLHLPQAQSKQISLQLQLREEFTVYADRNLLNSVLRNLISNAIKFTEAGGKIEIRAVRSGKEVKIGLKDTGIGMSPETVSRLFQPEYTFSSPGTANEKGTGLGLILCKEFISRSGGTLEVQSVEGKGSLFSFTLPEYIGIESAQACLSPAG